MTTTISSFQLIAIMICSRLIVILTALLFFKLPYNATSFVYILIGNGITYLLYLIFKRFKNPSAQQQYSFSAKLVLSAFCIACIVFLLFVSFVNFKETPFATNIYISIFLFLAATIYCSARGIETISRMAGLLAVVFIILFVFVISSFIPNNIYFSFDESSKNFILAPLFVNIGIIELFIFFQLKGHVKKNTPDRFWLYVVFNTVVSCMIVLCVYGIMGGFGSSYAFPLFTCVSASRSGFMRRFDVFLYCFYIILSLVSCSSLGCILFSFFRKRK